MIRVAEVALNNLIGASLSLTTKQAPSWLYVAFAELFINARIVQGQTGNIGMLPQLFKDHFNKQTTQQKQVNINFNIALLSYLNMICCAGEAITPQALHFSPPPRIT